MIIMSTRTEQIKPSWDAAVLIASQLNLDRGKVSNVINLAENGATIPFIARYRKDATAEMKPDLLREVLNLLEELRAVEARLQTVYSSIQNDGRMTPDLDRSLRSATSLLVLESLYAPVKSGHKGTYAERARAIGLGPIARAILEGEPVCLLSAVNTSQPGLESVANVEKGVMHIIADIVAKDNEALEEAREICQRNLVILETKKGRKCPNIEGKQTSEDPKSGKIIESWKSKLEQYFDYKIPVAYVKPHQILAIHRGEDHKILSVKVTIPVEVKVIFVAFCDKYFLGKIKQANNVILARQAILDAYDRLIKPLLSRQIWSDLKKRAERASIHVFSSNLKRLLLGQPVKNMTILGIDPGFKNGCKCAVINPSNQILWIGVLHLHNKSTSKAARKDLASLVNQLRCNLITIGNGAACRETELVISDMIKDHYFSSNSIHYCIVDECGSSTYSVSQQAQKELPHLDPTLRSAVSLARRIQDPLAELVKIEPRHIGVGMYQHDLNKSRLQKALNSVIEECVSFVGVDINTCSESLLQHVSGLTQAKVQNLMEWRDRNGFFTNRQQLLEVKGIGKKSFEQCAGFIRISKPATGSSGSVYGTFPVIERIKQEVPVKTDEDKKMRISPEAETGRKRKATEDAGPGGAKKAKVILEWNPLDATAVHPESYDLAYRLASYLNVNLEEFGQQFFINQVKHNATPNRLRTFCQNEQADLATVQLIVDAFRQPLSYDYRESSTLPLFKQEVVRVSDLYPEAEVTGRVKNVTHFGAFVDVGVGLQGFIHNSKMCYYKRLEVGVHVKVKVLSIDMERQRLSLVLTKVL